jgi:hypothetical protein
MSQEAAGLPPTGSAQVLEEDVTEEDVTEEGTSGGGGEEPA